VRHLTGVDRQHQVLAIAEQIEPGMRLAFCTRNADAAQLDLVRIATEIRAELESGAARQMAGAVYVSCAGRGGPHFGARHAELQVVRKALGDVPLVGFFAGGEIARHHLYGYTSRSREGEVSTPRSCIPQCWDPRFNSPPTRSVISLHHQLRMVSAHLHQCSQMQCNPGTRKTASLRIRIQLKAEPPVSFRTAIDRPCPLMRAAHATRYREAI